MPETRDLGLALVGAGAMIPMAKPQFKRPDMLKVSGKGSVTTCDGVTRRDFLQVGALGALGLTLSKFAAMQAMGAVSKGNDEKAVILIFNLGVPSQLDTWDMKPNAPSEIRGPFKPI